MTPPKKKGLHLSPNTTRLCLYISNLSSSLLYQINLKKSLLGAAIDFCRQALLMSATALNFFSINLKASFQSNLDRFQDSR